jgi:hypothetical protein
MVEEPNKRLLRLARNAFGLSPEVVEDAPVFLHVVDTALVQDTSARAGP